MPLLARKTFVPNQLPSDISPDVEVFTLAETKEAFTSYEGFLARYEQLRQPVWSCSVTGKINLTYEQAIKSELAASKQLQGFPEHFRRPALLFVHHCNSSLEPILDDVYEELHTRFAVGEPVEASVEHNGKQIDAVILEIHEPPSTPPKSADTSMEQGSAAASAARNGDASLLADPMLSPPAVVVNGSAEPKVDSAGETAGAAPSTAAAAAASGGEKENESEDDDEEEASPTYSVQFSDGTGTIKRDVDSDDITRLKRAPTRDVIRTFIKGCARRVRWRDSNVWVVKDELVQGLDLPCKFPELTYAVVTSAMSPVKRRRSSVVSPGEKKSKRPKTPKGPMKQMTLLDMVTGTPLPPKAQTMATLAKPSAARARASLGGFELEPQTPPAKPARKASTPSTPKTPDSKTKAAAKPRSRPTKAEQAAAAAARAAAVAAAAAKAKTVAMSKANKMIVDKVKNLDTAQERPKGYVARVLTQAARTLSTPERNTLPPEQRRLVEEKIAQRLKMEALKKLTPEERKARFDEQRKIKTEERRQVKIQQKLIEKETNRVHDDDDIAHPKTLPDLDAVTLPTGLRNDSFGDLAMVVEFLHVFQQVLAPQSTAPAINVGSLVQALVSGPGGMDVLSDVLISLLKIVSADQGNRKELGIKVSSMPLMRETAAELTRLLLLPSHLLESAATKTTATTAALSVSASPAPQRSPAAKSTEEAAADETKRATGEEDDEAMDTEDAGTAAASDDKKDGDKKDGDTEEAMSEDEDFEDEDLSPQLVEILVRMTSVDFQDLPPNDKLQLLVALCGRVLSTNAIQDYQMERRDAMKQLWRNRIEEGKEKKEKEEKEKQEKQAKKDQQLKKQQEMMQHAMDSFKVFKSEKGQSASSPGGQQATPSEAENTDPSNKEVKEEEKGAQRRPATERQMERERQLAKDKERRDREAKEMQVQREADLKEQRQHKFLNDIENCKRAFRLIPLGFDRFRRRCWSFSPSVLPGLFLEDDWSPDTPEVRTHGETTPKTGTVSGVVTPSANVGHSSPGAGSAADSTPVVMDAGNAKPVASNENGACRWRVFQTVAQFDEYVESLTATGVREKALKEAFEKQRSTLVSAIKKYSSNLDANGEQDSAADASADDLTVNKLRESYKVDLVEITQRLYRGGLGDPGDLELFQAKVATTEKMSDMGTLLLDVYHMINPRFTQGILCPTDVQETQLAIAKAEGKEKGFKMTPCRLAEWKSAVTAAGTLSRLHLLQAILDECIQWHKSAENARCKICRKKSDDVHMLLCDDCNQGFHIYCLRPALSKIPSGHWACPSCQPLNARRSARDVSYNENENSEEEVEEEEEEEDDSDDSGSEESGEEEDAAADEEQTESDSNEDTCTTCGAAGELLCCDTCPRVFHLECHVPPLRRPPRGKFVCCLCKNPRLAVGRSRSQTKKSQGSRSRSASRSKKSPIARRGSRRRVQEPEESEEEDEEVNTAEESEQESEQEEEEEDVEEVVEEEVRPQRSGGRGRKVVVQSSSDEESEVGHSESENGIEEASDNTDTEARQPARRTASFTAGRTAKRAAVLSKASKTKRSASALSSRAPPAKRRVRQLSDSEDDHSAMTASRRGGRDSNNLKEIASIINSVISHGEAEPFALPVSLKDVPDYLEVVREPMDFGTIRSRLKNMHYSDTETVLKDVALVFKNCDAYNHQSTNTYKRGVKVERYFCKMLKTQLKGHFSRYSTVLI